MNRKISLLFIASFFCVQLLSAMHVAEFGFDEHEHDGHVCDLYHYAKHIKYADTASDISVEMPVGLSFPLIFYVDTYQGSHPVGLPLARAPPLFS